MKILAVDADARHASLLKRHCRAILSHRLKRFDVADSCAAAAARLGAMAFDLVFLEPDLRRADGFALLDADHAPADRVIVVSARTELAMRAFEYGVVDFIPKPARRERLAKSLGRIVPRISPSAAEGRFLGARRAGHIDVVPVDQLVYVKGSDKYTELVLTAGRRTFCDKSIGRLAAMLPAAFVRIHRSYLVRFAMIARLIVQRGSRYSAELKSGERLPVGRSHYAALKARLMA